MFIDDTIAAIATATGEGGIGIIRISGMQSLEIAKKVFRSISNRKSIRAHFVTVTLSKTTPFLMKC